MTGSLWFAVPSQGALAKDWSELDSPSFCTGPRGACERASDLALAHTAIFAAD